jgi:hypothetical protein
MRPTNHNLTLHRTALASVGLLIAMWASSNHSMQSLQADESGVAAGEYDLKLARLYATSKYITWPDEGRSGNSPFVIAVLAPDPFLGGLEKLASRKIKDRPIVTQVIRTIDDLSTCHLIFIPSNADASLVKQALEKVRDKPVLVWLDQKETSESIKAACTFVRQDEKLVTETDQSELQRLGLLPDGRLMSLNLIRLMKSNK